MRWRGAHVIAEECRIEIPVELFPLDEGGRAIGARLHGVRNGIFELCSEAYVRPEALVEMRHAERTMEARVAYCKRGEDGRYEAGLLMARDAERRSEERTAVNVAATLRIGDSAAAIPVRVTDVSTSGLGLETARAIAVGTTVSIELKNGTASGEVRYCERGGGRFRAGVRIAELILASKAQRVALANSGGEAGEAALEGLTRCVQERQARYEAILFSLASAN
jgi:PilZ domain